MPIIPVRARFQVPETEEVLSPSASSGRHGTLLTAIVFGGVALTAAVLFWDLWFLDPISDLEGFEKFFGAVSRALKSAALGTVVGAAGLRAMRSPLAGFGILLGILGVLIVLFTTGTQHLFVFVTMIVFVVFSVIAFIGFPTSSRTRGGNYLLPADVTAQVRTYGKPGVGLADSGFEDAAMRAGVQGERASAEVLDTHISPIPGVRIFHSMRFAPGSQADVDHVLISGDRIAIIDSKLWPSAQYEWQSGITGAIIENNPRGTRRVRETHLIEARRSYREMFPGHEVQVWVLIHPASGGRDFSISNSFCPDGVRMGSADTVVNEVGQWLSEPSQTRAVLDRRILNQLGVLLKG